MSTSFTFNREEFTAVVRDWEELRTDIAAARARFAELDDLTRQLPAEDLVTRTFLGRAAIALDAAHGSNQAVGGYVEGFLDKLHDAGRRYVNDDTSAANTLNVTVDENTLG